MTESIDRNCLSYWFPKLEAAGLPVPKTEIVRWPGEPWGLADVCDGKEPAGWLPFVETVRQAALRISPTGPWFLRTGQGSGKHNWDHCCNVTDLNRLGSHIGSLVMWSHEVDMLGLAHEVWVVRERLPVKPVAILPVYNNMPLVTEVRVFVRGGKVICAHDYWPTGAIADGLGMPRNRKGEVTDPALGMRLLDLVEGAKFTPEDFRMWGPLACKVALLFADDGAWSVDLLKTDRGWHVTDMAEAHRSFHWEGCPRAAGFGPAPRAEEPGRPHAEGSGLVRVADEGAV